MDFPQPCLHPIRHHLATPPASRPPSAGSSPTGARASLSPDEETEEERNSAPLLETAAFAAPVPMPVRRIGNYELRRVLGKGGMGIVYRARDTKLDRDIALKFLPSDMSADDEAKARFVQEAKAASALDHPNSCTIHEIRESGEGKLSITMSFYECRIL